MSSLFNAQRRGRDPGWPGRGRHRSGRRPAVQHHRRRHRQSVPDHRAQDLRLAADAHGASRDRAQGHRDHRDRRVLAAQPAAERRPLALAARRALDADRLPDPGQAEGHAYDVNFAGADTREGFKYGGDTWSGAESDKALADSVKAAGNVILLANATFEGAATGVRPLPDQGYRLDAPGIVERRVSSRPRGAGRRRGVRLGHNRFVLDPDGPIRHTVPFVRAGGRAIPSLGLAAALRAAALRRPTSAGRHDAEGRGPDAADGVAAAQHVRGRHRIFVGAD